MSRRDPTDFSKSLDQLQAIESGDPDAAPTPLVRDILLARKKPLDALSNDEIGRLVVQLDGLPFILDLVFPLLEANPLFDGGYYAGDVLSILIRANEDVWHDRPEYRARLADLYRRAVARSPEDNDGFLDSLGRKAGRSAD